MSIFAVQIFIRLKHFAIFWCTLLILQTFIWDKYFITFIENKFENNVLLLSIFLSTNRQT